MITHNEISELFRNWSKLSYTKILQVFNYETKFELEFVLDVGDPDHARFLKNLTELTVKKHPSGSVSWIGYKNESSQYKVYRLEFLAENRSNEVIDRNKIEVYLGNLNQLLKTGKVNNDAPEV